MDFFSEDIRNSHEYSADSDTIIAQMVDPQNANRLIIFLVKNRHGPKVFQNNSIRATLEVRPEIGLVKSIDDTWIAAHKAGPNILQKVENELDTLDALDDGKSDADESEIEEVEKLVTEKKSDLDMIDSIG
jgi:hypothetical protein